MSFMRQSRTQYLGFVSSKSSSKSSQNRMTLFFQRLRPYQLWHLPLWSHQNHESNLQLEIIPFLLIAFQKSDYKFRLKCSKWWNWWYCQSYLDCKETKSFLLNRHDPLFFWLSVNLPVSPEQDYFWQQLHCFNEAFKLFFSFSKQTYQQFLDCQIWHLSKYP